MDPNYVLPFCFVCFSLAYALFNKELLKYTFLFSHTQCFLSDKMAPLFIHRTPHLALKTRFRKTRSPEGRYLPPELQRATSTVHSRGCRGPGNPSLHSCFLKAEDKGSAPSEPVYEVLRSLFPTHPLPVSVLFQVSILPLRTPPSPSVFQQSAPISSPLPC